MTHPQRRHRSNAGERSCRAQDAPWVTLAWVCCCSTSQLSLLVSPPWMSAFLQARFWVLSPSSTLLLGCCPAVSSTPMAPSLGYNVITPKSVSPGISPPPDPLPLPLSPRPPPPPGSLSNLDSWLDVPPGKLYWDALQSSQTHQVQMELLFLTKRVPPTTFPISGVDNTIHPVLQDLDTLVCHHTKSQSHLPPECFKSIYFSPSSPASPQLGHHFLSWRLFQPGT